jgi:hypothetical protein
MGGFFASDDIVAVPQSPASFSHLVEGHMAGYVR